MRVAVVGAGIVGLACADELVRAGHDVRVLDPAPASGATRAAAGMLAPGGEAWFGEVPLLRLGVASAELWPAYASDLTARSGMDVDLRRNGTVLVGVDHDDLTHVQRTLDLLREHGVAAEPLTRHELRRHEPSLGRSLGGALLPHDHQVDPRRVADALLAVLGDRVVRAAVDRVEEAVLLDDGRSLACDAVVWAVGVPAAARQDGRWPWLRPVQGETVRLRGGDAPSRVVRARVRGEQVYVVPRADGEVVVGATEEQHAGAPRATVGAVTRLLGAARALVPGLDTAEVLEVTARHRPGTPDNGPVLGPDPVAGGGPRQVLALGHYRGGVLLAPLTARVVRAHVEGAPVPDVAVAFTADRFTTDSPPGPQTADGTPHGQGGVTP